MYISFRTQMKMRVLQCVLSARAGDFSLLHSLQTGIWAYSASCSVGTGGCFLEIKRPGHEADHSPPSVAEVKNCGAIPPLPHMPSWYSA
jgi:hypothetical protein